MKALIFRGDRRVQLVEVPRPEPGPGEVLVQVARAAVCGTDVHKYRLPAGEAHELEPGVPIIAGHEPAGWAMQSGAGARSAARGTRVLVAGVIGCGRCAQCLAGYNTACEAGPYGLHWRHHGGDAEYLVMPAVNALPLPDAVSFDTAVVLACAGGTAMTGLRECGASAGMQLGVVGLGPVGLCAVILGRALGCSVFGLDPNPERRKLALELGAAQVSDPLQQDALGEVKSWSGGRGCEVTLECVGNAAAQKLALELLGARGTAGMAGLGGEPLALDVTHSLIGKSGARIVGIAATPIKYFHELLALAAHAALPFERLITHRLPLERAQEALELMESGRSGKVVLEIASVPVTD
ncbi:MAG TPA: zinc-binding dehydrogenase [Polyangiaceae bacterium]|jgi:threonine dehydrogenase-like Zn-dependent dehydrogenase|nr:zinc-binding dehydrogenase [Polyangiaceae bacterium]